MQLIVNGDDFGACEAVNLAIIKAFDEGILTSCSLMVAGSAFEQAVELAKARPKLAVGLHLVTICGRAVLSRSEIPHLVDSNGYFPYSPFITGLRYYFLEAAKEELQKEIFAQFDKFFSSGLKISHIDGHLHMHMHPTVFSILIEAATKYGVKHIRLPREPLIHTLKLRRRNLFNKLLWWTVFHLLSKSAVSRIEGRGFITPKTVYGLLESGAMTEDFVLGLLQQISSVTTELYCHPELYTPETENRLGEEEMMALLSSKVKKLLQERNIHLGTYADL